MTSRSGLLLVTDGDGEDDGGDDGEDVTRLAGEEDLLLEPCAVCNTLFLLPVREELASAGGTELVTCFFSRRWSWWGLTCSEVVVITGVLIEELLISGVLEDACFSNGRTVGLDLITFREFIIECWGG